MNSQIEKAINVITKLDSWDIQSVFGGVNYIARQAVLNAVVRAMPDPPEQGSGLENFTAWEQAMKVPEIKNSVSGIVGIADQISDILTEYTMTPPSQYEDVLKFMVERPPQRVTSQNDYNNRKKLGMRPQMPMSTFVELEYTAAMQRHAQLVAKGEAAVRLLHSIDGSDDMAPEWLYEAIQNKILQKLEFRWMKAEQRRTNPKIIKSERDLADANQRLIEEAITELGGNPPKFDAEMAADDEMDEGLAGLDLINKNLQATLKP